MNSDPSAPDASADPSPADEPDEAAADAPDEAADDRPERETGPVELLWDLVFVFAITQVTTLFAHDPGWTRGAEAMLVLALVWWSWSAFAWGSNAHDADSSVLRAHLLAATVLIFITGLAVPHAFGADALTFAVAYAAVRLLHLSLYAAAASAGRALRRAILLGFGLTVLVSLALLIAGALVPGTGRAVLWTLAMIVDYGGPGWWNRARLRGLQRVAVAHFADRYGDFVILCLGESVVSIGVGVGEEHRPLSAALVVTASLGLLIAVGLWWTYFDRLADAARERLRGHPEPVLAANDAFSMLHLPLVAGIVVFAAGVRLTVHQAVTVPMPEAGRIAFCGGIALYLAGLSAFQARLLGSPGVLRPIAVLAIVALAVAGGGLRAWTVTGGAAAVVLALCAGESWSQRGGRSPRGGRTLRGGRSRRAIWIGRAPGR